MGWDNQQTAFGDALTDPLKGVPDLVAKTGNQPSHKRFNVYRNNIMVSLTEAIIDAYPVVALLVGEPFATAMARVYVGANLPKSPVLIEYGRDYPEFIEQFEPAKTLPYLADLARLERAWLLAYHSADRQPVSIEALASFNEEDLANLRFTFCPSVALLRSDFPIVSMWSAHQGDEVDEAQMNDLGGAECALVNRPVWDVDVRILEPGTFAFFTSLQAGLPLGVAIDKGSTFSNFDPAGAINAVFETKTVAAIK